MLTVNDVVRAHRAMLTRDTIYSEETSPYNHRRVILAQRIYYRRLAHYLRATLPPDTARTKRAEALYNRARQNRRQHTNDAQWQDMALYQVRRARLVLQRARAIEEYNAPHPPAPTHRPQPPRLPRVKHPVTGRSLYYDDTTNTYHKVHPPHTTR
jgi:hypothetical protein